MEEHTSLALPRCIFFIATIFPVCTNLVLRHRFTRAFVHDIQEVNGQHTADHTSLWRALMTTPNWPWPSFSPFSYCSIAGFHVTSHYGDQKKS